MSVGKTIILRGLPGSGKSTVSAQFPDAIICSADHFFVGTDGVYRYDRAKIKQAHDACLRKFLSLLDSPAPLVVDNTNMTVAEIAPYYEASEAMGRETKLVTVKVPVAVSVARNVHSVPATVIEGMARRMTNNDAHMPDHWHHEIRGTDVN